MIVTEMTFSDLNKIKENLEEEFDKFWSYETLKEELESPFSKYFVAKDEQGKILGFVGIKIILDTAEIMNIVTKKEFRHLGVASKLLEKIISYCKGNKIKFINLEVNEQNTIAINLYKKYNLEKVGLRKKYYKNTYDAILMTLKID